MSPDAYRLRDPKPKPRVIRKAIKRNKAGRPTWAVDYKINARMQRVKGRDAHYCAAGVACPFIDGLILPGAEYAKVHANEGRPKIIRGRAIYSPRDYHFDCVPEQYRPMIRFFTA